MEALLDLVLGLAAVTYIASAIFLTIFISNFAALLVIYALTRHRRPVPPKVDDDELLSVTIQLPIYNEAHVVDRLLDACVGIDYPSGKVHIQVLDDSTDETTDVIRHKIEEWKAKGVDYIELVRRPERKGYKAGALAYGLELVQTDCVAIFDADFIPPKDFLRKTMPFFNQNPNLGLIQTRWAHLNLDYNWLTRAQALSIDGHFAIEQVARNRGRLPMSMNGTGGIWRVNSVKDAGGWSSSTLTEDLDLSYRALMKGWDFLYLVDVPVPGELPPQVQAYKLQQSRWATGSTECLIKHALPLTLSRRFSPAKKFMGLMHLSQYLVQPIILLVFLLTPVLIIGDMFHKMPDLRIIGIFGIIPPLIISIAQAELYRDWAQRLLFFPIQFIVGAAIVLSNSRAVIAAFHKPGVEREFKRTPKFRLTGRGQKWASSRYALKIDIITIGELLLALYAITGFIIALIRLPIMAPYMLTYAVSFALFAFWNVYQSIQLQR
ncbi:MAG: glycosyltransferase [Chloroflexi bacterium]|nr:glycosyltransferase [Chloroflexota bacterium]